MKAVKVKNTDSYILAVSGDELWYLIKVCSGDCYSNDMVKEMERVME